jgi:pyruvate dehydrogenase E2 component (dihydrolipoamide acetyltransferase)
MEQAESTIAAGSASGKGETERVELDRAGQGLARRAAESKATIPHLYLRTTVDMGPALEMIERLNGPATAGGYVSTTDLAVRAVAFALREHPRANGSYRDGGLELYSRVNVGFTVANGDSVVVPTIDDAERLGLGEIAARRQELAEQAVSGAITAAALSGATFTVMDLGDHGVRSFDPVIVGGQAGILGTGEVAARPVVKAGAVTASPLMDMTLACDHRILFGEPAAAFLAEVRRNLEEPERLA